jgi:glutamate carboxypeptidase
MDLHALPIDAENALSALGRWVTCESPTYDAAAVNRMMALAASDLADLGAVVERLPGRGGYGDCLRAAFPHPRAGEPGVLVLGHLDTVHPVGTLDVLPFRRDGAGCTGPGIVDMKGGNRAALEAIAAVARIGATTPLPVTVLFTSDEEVGSPTTRDLIEAEALRQRAVLVPEPARDHGGVVSGRYAIARFVVTAHGRPSHAGAALSEGRSAIAAMAKEILAIEAMTGPDCTFSVGTVEGGQWVNCVPTLCTARVLSMAKRQADLDAGIARMLALAGAHDDGRLEVEVDVVRPVWEPSEGTLALHATAARIARDLGFELPHGSAGGGSDGNFTGAMGIPTLDGLGVRGSGIHTLDERMAIDSLAERARLLAGLLMHVE